MDGQPKYLKKINVSLFNRAVPKEQFSGDEKWTCSSFSWSIKSPSQISIPFSKCFSLKSEVISTIAVYVVVVWLVVPPPPLFVKSDLTHIHLPMYLSLGA